MKIQLHKRINNCPPKIILACCAQAIASHSSNLFFFVKDLAIAQWPDIPLGGVATCMHHSI